MTKTSETQSQIEEVKSPAPSKPSGRKSILALSVFALGLNATAAVYTMSPSEFALPDVSRLAELLPHERAPAPIPEPVIAALKDIQSAQQQHTASLQESSSSLQQSKALLEQDSTMFVALRQTLSDEQSDIKKISTQLSTLMVKVDTLQSAISPEVTSSISKARARNRLSAMARKKWVRSSKAAGPVSVGGAPLTAAPAILQSPEG